MSAQRPIVSDLDSPRFVVPSPNRIPADAFPRLMMEIPPSRMFLIRDALSAYRAARGQGAQTFDASQGDGGASLPGVPVSLLERALQLQMEHGTAYDQPWGTTQFRMAAVGPYWHLDAASGWGPENVVFVQGGRDGLQKAYAAMVALGSGEIGAVLVVSRVPWVSYNWGPYAVGLNVMLAPGLPEEGWRYTPEGIRACADLAAREGRKLAGLIITSPDNPTGRTLPLDEQIALTRAAFDAGFPFVLFDWMYHWVSDAGPNDVNTLLRAFSPQEREKLIVMDGITKSLGASNIRSAHLLAGKAVVRFITSQASHGVIPSYYGQAVAIAAYEEGFAQAAAPILEPIRQSRHIMRDALAASGARHVLGDGYYAFIDCGPFIQSGNLGDSEGVLTYLGGTHGIAIVPGIYFSDAGANWIRFSYALAPEVTRGALERFFTGLSTLL